MARAVLLLTIALVLSTSASARANGEIFALAGGGTASPREGQPATRTGLPTELSTAALSGGGFLFDFESRIWRADPQGVVHPVAVKGLSRIGIADLETLPDGGFLIADGDHNLVLKVDPAGAVTTVAGGGDSEADGVPATKADLSPRGIAALPGGGFLVADAYRVRRVGPDGTIRTIAGNGGLPDPSRTPHGQPATSLPIDAEDVAVAADGSVLIADEDNSRVDRVAPDGTLSVAASAPAAGMHVRRVTAFADGSFAFLTLVGGPMRIWRATPGGPVTALAGIPSFTAPDPPGIDQRLNGQRATGAFLGTVVDIDATADGGLLLSHGAPDVIHDKGFVSYVAPAAPAVLGAAILRDRDRVFTPGGLQAVTVSLTMPATVTLTAGGHSIASALPAGVSRVMVPPLMAARPQRVSLAASDGTQRAFDSLRLFPPGWLPLEAAGSVADAIASDVDHCRQFSATRVDCLTNKGDFNCHSVTVRLINDRLRWAEYGPCAIRSHPRLAHGLRPLTRREWSCETCSRRFLGTIDEADLIPAT
jgi:hypothetical protein